MSEALYHDAILALAKDRTHAGRLDAPARTGTLDNPLCGDRVTLDIELGDDGTIRRIRHFVRGCALCQASAAALAAALEGRTAADLDAHMATNVRAPVVLAQAFVAALQADRAGLIVNIIDQRVWRPTPQYFSYSLSKAALWYATQTMAQALAPRIRVNAIGPGPTFGSTHQAPGSFEAEAEGTPLGRRVTGEDIAAALRYLIDARSVTGQMIAVDSGQHLAWRTPDIVDF